ncbi:MULTISPECIES: protein kinase domain-containing protein [unclassified Colwellia]|uniref:protein kinase domain-containing protein n=1 Tax=unclassified Colwellia TaxID=196834 RepID=UPI0015F35ACE|nr:MULTISPECIES: protein kinase [unclassified Colwellia]MBA6356634.1 protein kinase [Colwellia sp. BRX8-3]MBA6360942.1 protein kinase [Colwellia sp. BRX8-6]MBA6368392.1 protein kinase [Colwellia sp. BRX8-5]MBA6375408.1 protein kinase [Colwellia sp. BRX8-2]
MSLLYELFTEYSSLPKELLAQKMTQLHQQNSTVATELSCLLEHSGSSANEMLEYLHLGIINNEDTSIRIGRLINNKYQIQSLIGQGGMSDVYLAKRIDGLIEHTVAIKYFALADSNKTALNMIKKEAQLLANLDHQFIASFIDIGHDDHQEPNIMMEYINGITLYEFLNSSPSEAAKNKVDETLKTAIAHAKSKAITHGDLTKNNVLVDINGNANIVDFDIANFTDSTTNDTQPLCV